MMQKDSKIYVAGHRGLVGSSIIRQLEHRGYRHIITKTRSEMDLKNQSSVAEFFRRNRPEYVFLAAARVGGIHANSTYPAEFIYDNLAIQTHILHQSYLNGVKRLIFLGSSCIYPKQAPQPIKEEYLLTGALEPTNAPYAVAKIAGIQMCWSYNQQYGTRFVPVMPTNLYGPRDNFDLETSHVFPAFIRRFHLAKLTAGCDTKGLARDETRFGQIPNDMKEALNVGRATSGALSAAPEITVWGTGFPRREFLHVDDLGDACIYLMTLPFEQICSVMSNSPAGESGHKTGKDSAGTYAGKILLNIGTGTDLSIKSLAEKMLSIIGVTGDLKFDDSMPDGTPKKLLDVSRIEQLGWKARIDLDEGIRQTYQWYLQQAS